MMNDTRLRFSLFVALALVAFGTACGGSANITLGPQLEEARTLNSELRAEWTQTEDTFNSTLTAVEAFPEIGVDVSKVDMNLVQKALTEVFNADTKKAAVNVSEVATGDTSSAMGEKALTECAKSGGGESMKSLRDYTKLANEEVAVFINQKVKSVCLIRQNVKLRLPEMSTDMNERYLNAKVKIEELKLTADTLKTNADTNGDLDEAAKAKFDLQYKDLQEEIKAIEELLMTMEGEVGSLQDRLNETTEKFTYGLSNFGLSQ